MIKTQSADGVTHEFPDDTKPEVVDRVMKNYAEQVRDKSTAGGEFIHGVMDPIEGGGQLIANILPKRVERTFNEANNWLAEHSGGLVRKLPEGGKNEQMQQREAAIQAERGSNTSMDWPRLAGNILSPVNYIGTGLVRGAGVLADLGRAVAGGIGAGAVQPVTKDKDRYWTEKAFQTGEGALIGGATGGVGLAGSRAVTKLGEYVARNYPENLQSAAVQKILRRIAQDNKAGGPTAADAIDLVNTAKKPMTLTDVGGENVRSLAGNVARQPGSAREVARQFLTKRDEAAALRLSADINKYVSGGPSMRQATEALLQARSAAARPAYDAVHTLKGVWSPRLEQFLQDPIVKTGLQRGYEIERLQSLAEGRPLTASQLGVDLDVNGEMKLLDKPNMRLLDMAKQGLDAIVADERNPLTGRLSARGVAVDNMRRAYVQTIDDLDSSGVYKKARAAWAGYSQSLDAVRMGRNVFKMSPEENAAEIERMPPANREFYRLGVADMLRERLAKAGLSSDEAKQLIRNPWMRDQLKPVFRSSEDFTNFVDAVSQEARMFGTRREVLGGSQTAARTAEDQGGSMLEGGAHIAGKLASGHLFSAAKTAYQMWRDLGLRPNPELNSKISEILFTTDLPEDVVNQLVTGAGRVLKSNPAFAKAAVGITGAATGAAPVLTVDATKERAPQGVRP